jgi:hypothetical protein
MDTPDNASTPQVLPPPPSGAYVPPPLPPAPPAPPRQRFPSWKQALVTFFGGIVLAATACVGFLASLGGNFEHGGDDFLTPLAAILFGVGLLAIFVGFIFTLMRAIRAMTEKKGSVS